MGGLTGPLPQLRAAGGRAGGAGRSWAVPTDGWASPRLRRTLLRMRGHPGARYPGWGSHPNCPWSVPGCGCGCEAPARAALLPHPYVPVRPSPHVGIKGIWVCGHPAPATRAGETTHTSPQPVPGCGPPSFLLRAPVRVGAGPVLPVSGGLLPGPRGKESERTAGQSARRPGSQSREAPGGGGS